MKQYCRYCAYCHDCDTEVYCEIKNELMTKRKAKAVNRCKDFEFNEIDVFYGGDMSKVYKPRGPYRPNVPKSERDYEQLSLFDTKGEE